MRLIVCCLCTDADPFLCPFKFRRSYMLLHLEKAHDLPVKDMEFVRQMGSNKQGAVWMGVASGVASQILVEAEFSLIEARVDMRPIPKSDAVQRRTASLAPSPPAENEAHAASWTPAAMQKLYRERDLRKA